MVINFPNITLYFFKRATPLRLTKRTFSQWSSYIIIYSEMFCILPKDWKPHVRKCCGCALNLTLCSKFFKKWIVKFVMSRQAPKPPKTSKPPKPPNHRGCGGVDSCFHIATHVKSLRMSSSWLWWKCVRAPAKVFNSHRFSNSGPHCIVSSLAVSLGENSAKFNACIQYKLVLALD